MPPRDPGKSQLDFPQLVADLIRELQLLGAPIGLLDFVPSVQPVYIVQAREGALNLTAVAPAFTSAEIFTDETTSPALNAVLADTAALPAGTYDVKAWMSFGPNGGAGAANTPELQLRNAANNANLASWPYVSQNQAGFIVDESNQFDIALEIGGNERLRWQQTVGAFAGLTATVIAAKRRVTP